MTPAKASTAQHAPTFRTLALTAVAMLFFAANSLLARFALRAGEIDWGSFTVIRIAAGSISLVLLTALRREGIGAALRHGSPRAALALFTYAVAFSYAYLSLNAGTGALVLFAAVQITMLAIGIARGENPGPLEWTGLAVAFAGFVCLAFPGITAPSTLGLFLMAVSGAAWGYYTLAAKGFSSMIAATAGNFLRAIPLAAAALFIAWTTGQVHITSHGAALAATSGALTSGIGYAIWYVALRHLRTSLAAIVQLTVPLLAAAAGVLLLGEQFTWRLLLASAAILGGVALALAGKLGAAKK